MEEQLREELQALREENERLKKELPDSLCTDYWVPKCIERQHY